MLEVRFLIETGQVTGWCGDKSQFGHLDRGRDTEGIVILDTGVPSGFCSDYTFTGQTLDYQEPSLSKPRDLGAELDAIKERIDDVETQLRVKL